MGDRPETCEPRSQAPYVGRALLLLVLCVLRSPVAAADAKEEVAARAARVARASRAAVELGSAWLVGAQAEDGSWADSSYQNRRAGVTGLCLRALIDGNVPTHRKSIDRGIDWLMTCEPLATPDASMMVVALSRYVRAHCSAEPPHPRCAFARRKVAECVQRLRDTQISPAGGDELAGGWSYSGTPGDIINTWHACEALQHASELGVEVPLHVWHAAANAVLQLQVLEEAPDSLGRREADRETPGEGVVAYSRKTRAGGLPTTVAGLRILGEYRNLLVAAGVPPESATALALEHGSTYVKAEYQRALPRKDITHYGRMLLGDWIQSSDPALFREVPWYEDGAEFLVRTQSRQGAWEGQGVGATAMAVIFLARRTKGPGTDSAEVTPQPAK